MASVNKVIIVGNLGKDPETRTFPSGDMIANVNVATTDKWKDKESGEMKEATEWHRVIFNGRLAEIASEYLTKGSQVYIEGSLRTRKYTDNAGVEKYTTEIRADRLQMLSKREGGDQQDGGGQQRQQPQRQQAQGQQRSSAPARNGSGQRSAPGKSGGSSGWDDMDSDIPFISQAFAHDSASSLERRKQRYDCR